MKIKKLPQKPTNLREYECDWVINEQHLTKLEISPYYEKHNREYIDALKRKGIKEKPQVKVSYIPHAHPKIIRVEANQEKIIIWLEDGRELSIPFSWLTNWGFKNVKPEQLKNYEIWEGGNIIYWPEINEPLHVRHFTDGFNAPCCCG